MPRSSAVDRFWSKVVKTEDCWLWTAGKHERGYGLFSLDNKTKRAHRLAYEWLVGPIPTGLMLDHTCNCTSCVNPAHLEPVTNRENQLRAAAAQRGVCVNGHRYTEHNTYWRTDGRRACRACGRKSSLAYYHRKKHAA